MSRNIFVKFIKIGKAIGFYRVPTFLTTLAVMHPAKKRVLQLALYKAGFSNDKIGTLLHLKKARVYSLLQIAENATPAELQFCRENKLRVSDLMLLDDYLPGSHEEGHPHAQQRAEVVAEKAENPKRKVKQLLKDKGIFKPMENPVGYAEIRQIVLKFVFKTDSKDEPAGSLPDLRIRAFDDATMLQVVEALAMVLKHESYSNIATDLRNVA